MKGLNKRVWKMCDGQCAHIFRMNGKKKQTVTVVITDTPERPKLTKNYRGFSERGTFRGIDKMVDRGIKRLNKFGFFEIL